MARAWTFAQGWDAPRGSRELYLYRTANKLFERSSFTHAEEESMTDSFPYRLTRLNIAMSPLPGMPACSKEYSIPVAAALRMAMSRVADGNVSSIGLTRVVIEDGVPDRQRAVRDGAKRRIPTAVEEFDGIPYVFYGMADAKIGVARLERVAAAN